MLAKAISISKNNLPGNKTVAQLYYLPCVLGDTTYFLPNSQINPIYHLIWLEQISVLFNKKIMD